MIYGVVRFVSFWKKHADERKLLHDEHLSEAEREREMARHSNTRLNMYSVSNMLFESDHRAQEKDRKSKYRHSTSALV